jgi:hypothetical protein
MANGTSELKGVLKRNLNNDLINDFFISNTVDYSPHNNKNQTNVVSLIFIIIGMGAERTLFDYSFRK